MDISLMPHLFVASGLSSIGLVRQNNEDAWACLPELGLAVLADGMGGHQAGEIASHTAVDALVSFIKEHIKKHRPKTLAELNDLVKKAMADANSTVFKKGRGNAEWRGMGTTLCSLLATDVGVVYAHVGDSRIYRLRENVLSLLTKDHSLIRELVDQGQLSERQEVDYAAYKNIITKAIGTESRIEATIKAEMIRSGDIYLLCTDGLTDLVSLEEIESILNFHSDLQKIAHTLIELGLEKGGYDNITVVLAKVS